MVIKMLDYFLCQSCKRFFPNIYYILIELLEYGNSIKSDILYKMY